MELLKSILVIIFVTSGLFFFIMGTLGLLRMPDVFSRMHATAKCDTLGAGLILMLLIIHKGFDVISIKLLLIIVFIWVTNPTAVHIIAKAEYNRKKNN